MLRDVSKSTVSSPHGTRRGSLRGRGMPDDRFGRAGMVRHSTTLRRACSLRAAALRFAPLLLVGSLAGPAVAQTLRLELRGAFDVGGGRVVGVDVASGGERFATVGEHGDVAVWSRDGRVLGDTVLPDPSRLTYLALHPTRPLVACCFDRSQRLGPPESDLLLAAGGADSASSRPPSAPPASFRLHGAVLAVAWNAEGSLLGVGRATRTESCVDVFTPVRDRLVAVETVRVGSILAIADGREEPPPALAAFADRWRAHTSELLPKPDDRQRLEAPVSDGMLVADARARFARFVDGVGVGVDRIGQVLVGDGDRVRVHAPNRGPVLGLAFTPDGRFLAAASRAAVTVARTDGTQRHLIAGKHLVAAGDAGSEFVLLGARLRRYDAERAAFGEGARLPAADTGTGEGDAPMAGHPQLRTFLRLPGERLVVGGYTQFGHEGLVVDLEAHRVRMVADTDREADGRLVVDLQAAIRLAGAGWASLERLRAYQGAFRRVSVLRTFDGDVPRWSREFQGLLSACTASLDGNLVAVGDESGAVVLLEPARGETRATVELPRPARWLAFLGADELLAHDGRTLSLLRVPDLQRVAATQLPVDAIVTSTALEPARGLLALGGEGRVRVFSLVR